MSPPAAEGSGESSDSRGRPNSDGAGVTSSGVAASLSDVSGNVVHSHAPGEPEQDYEEGEPNATRDRPAFGLCRRLRYNTRFGHRDRLGYDAR